jgi:hypothetical protein
VRQDFAIYEPELICQRKAHRLLRHRFLHVLRRAKRTNGEYFGDIIPLDRLRSAANLIPWFGKAANKRLSSTNSRALSEDFLLNKYWDKETFFALYNELK